MMIPSAKKEECCGCGACEQICPTHAIVMQSDEQGFLYPKVDNARCVRCGRCREVCPVSRQEQEKPAQQQAFLVQHKDKAILKESASGGAFSGLAQVVLEQGGVVFGAAYDEDFSVRHTYVERAEELRIFRNSKYVQSRIGNAYRQVQAFLSQKRYVLFSGTPCQIEGLLHYLGKDSPYLVTADIVCHAVPSPLVWQTYLAILQESDPNIADLRFRDKTKYGYLYSQFAVVREGQHTHYEGIETNLMLRAFFSEIANRPSCYECRFKKRYRRSDITMWDCFDLHEFTDSGIFSQNDGISRILVHSDKGRKLAEILAKYCTMEEISPENALHYDAKEMLESAERHPLYEQFWKSFADSPKDTLQAFFPVTAKSRWEAMIRRAAFRTGMYASLRGFYKKHFGNRKR